MRWIISLVILVVIVFALEFYAFQALKTVSKSKIIRYSWVLISLVVYVNFFYVVISYDRTLGQTPKFQMAMGVMLTVLLPKLVVLIAMFGEDVYRSILKLFSVISSGETKSFAGRRKFISQLALGLAAIPFAAFIYGIIQGKYNYKVLKIYQMLSTVLRLHKFQIFIQEVLLTEKKYNMVLI